MVDERESEKSTNGIKKVLLQYDSLWHYRKSLFERLSKSNVFDFQIVCGEKSVYQNLKTFSPSPEFKVNYIKNRFLVKRFGLVWQHGIFKAFKSIKPDYLILKGVDLHIISSLMLSLYAKLSGTKVIFWGHATFGNQGVTGKYIRLIFYKLAAGILVYDYKGKTRLVENGIPQERVFVIGNCIPDEDIPNDPDIDNYDKNRLIYTGRLHSRKKVDVLIKAVHHAKKKGCTYKLDIIGDGPERSNLECLSSNLLLSDNITFHGALYGADASKYYKKAAICIIPSAVGLSLYHSFAHGVPVVSDKDYTLHGPEFNNLEEGVNGELYQNHDFVSLANTLTRISRKIKDMRKNCLIFFKANCTSEIVESKITSALRQLK